MGTYVIGKPTLRDVRNCGEYATLYRWNLDLSVLGEKLGVDAVNYKELNVLCETANLPSKTVDRMEIRVRGHRHYQPGRVIPTGTIQFTFLETINNPTHKLLAKWINNIWRYNTGIGGLYEDMLIDNISVTRLNNQDQGICKYDLYWCFLEDYTLPVLDGATSGPMVTTITLSYNDFAIVPCTVNAASTQPTLIPVDMTHTYLY